MRRLLLLVMGSALLFTFGVGPAQADNGPHVLSGAVAGFDQLVGIDGCADCHRVHTPATESRANRDGLCLACHGPSRVGATTNVVDGLGESAGAQDVEGSATPGALRSGGFDSALIASGAATKETYRVGARAVAGNQKIPVLAVGQATTSKHNVASIPDTAWDLSSLNSAGGAPAPMECISCHNPHGNGNYRTLRTFAADSGASAAAGGVMIPDAGVKVYTTANYWLSGDSAVPPVTSVVNGVLAVRDGYAANVGRWCATCHQRNHFDKTITMTGATCVTCHVAHGSNASLSGAKADPVKLVDGSEIPRRGHLLRVDTSRAICVMCHER